MDLVFDILTLVLLTLLYVAPYGVMLLLARDIWRLIRPQRRLFQGRYRDAFAAADALRKSWLRVFPNVGRTSRYTMALALHLDGALDDALDILTTLGAERLDDNLRYAVRSLEAGTLVLLGRDPERARAAIDEARRIRETREDVLIAALASFEVGTSEDAQALFARAETMVEPARTKLGMTMLLSVPTLKRTIEATLRALYLHRAGRAAEARRDLEIALASPHANVYVGRARELLAPGVPGPDDVPPSLRPHVLG